MPAFEIEIASASERGRRAANEDALRLGRAGTTRYAVLADGAGGHARGAEASRRVVERVGAGLEDRAEASAAFAPATLTRALLDAHAALQREQVSAKGRARMHATAVVLWIDEQRSLALWSHVGDSRLYRLRYGAVETLTADDSVVQRMVEGGVLTAAQAQEHPLKNQLLAALGMQESIEPHTPAAAVELEDGDVFLLCTDGWWGALDDAVLTQLLAEAQTPQAWLDAMRRHIDAHAAPRQDNFSAIAVWVCDPAENTQPMDDDDELRAQGEGEDEGADVRRPEPVVASAVAVAVAVTDPDTCTDAAPAADRKPAPGAAAASAIDQPASIPANAAGSGSPL